MHHEVLQLPLTHVITHILIPGKNVSITRSLRDGTAKPMSIPVKKQRSPGAQLKDGDNPCTSSYPISQYFLWTLFQGDYELAAKTVLKRINYNRVGGEFGIYNNCWPIITGLDSNCAELSQVACIMNAYYNEVMAQTIPEYDPANLYKTNKTQARIASETETIITHVTRVTGQVYFRVKEVLAHLYWATYSNTSDRISYQYISPLQYNQNKDKIQKPKDIGSGVDAASDAVSGTFDGIITTAKWILTLGAIGVGVYLLWPVLSTVKSK